jgi:hypothetical protein
VDWIPALLEEKLRQLNERLWLLMSWDNAVSSLYMTYIGGRYTYPLESDYYISTETTDLIMTNEKFDYDLFWMLVNTLDIHPTAAIAASLS